MKKFTIVLSDDDDDLNTKIQSPAFPSSGFARDLHSAPTEPMISTNSQMNNISQVISFVSNSQRCNNNTLDKIKNDYAASVRSPIPKSDEEIRFWVMTSKPPCLYDSRSDALSTENVNKYEDEQAFQVNHLPINVSTSHPSCVNNTKSLELKSAQNRRSHLIREDGRTVEKPFLNSGNSIGNIICGNHKPSGRNFSTVVDADSIQNTKLITKYPPVSAFNGQNVSQNKGSKRLNTPLAEHSNNKFFKHGNSRLPEPLNDYDSGSSVLTINYIQYVNDKAKTNKKSNSFNMTKRRKIQSSPLLKAKNPNKLTFFKNNNSDGNGILSHHCYPSSQDYKPEITVRENKTLSKKKQIFNQSLEEMKRKNDLVLNTSKTSSSSVENSFSDKQRLFKKSFFKASIESDKICNPLGKIENKASFSDYGSSTTSCPAVDTESSRKQNVSVAYNRIETHYISSCTNTDSTYSSMIKFKETTTYISESQ